MDSQALPCCHLLLGREGGTGWLLTVGRDRMGWGTRLDFLSFGKASMMFPPYIYKETHFSTQFGQVV